MKYLIFLILFIGCNIGTEDKVTIVLRQKSDLYSVTVMDEYGVISVLQKRYDSDTVMVNNCAHLKAKKFKSGYFTFRDTTASDGLFWEL